MITRIMGLVMGLGLGLGQPAWASDLDAGREVYAKANCVGCHKWHGGGGGGYGGAALSLRETLLDRDQLVEVIRCGRPDTRMPYHDRQAYKATACYGGLDKEGLGDAFPPQAASFLRDRQIEAVTDYVIEVLQGKGPPTREDCIAYWGEGSAECRSL